MRIRFIVLSVLWLIGASGMAQEVAIYPVPQSVILKGQMPWPDSYRMEGDTVAHFHTYRQLGTILKKGKQQHTVAVCIGKRGEKAVSKYTRMIPRHPEGYYLSIDKDRIVLAGNDERGLFYAMQTLRQLAQGEQLPLAEVKDYPLVRFRGVVEGFYGTPWSHQARMRQLQFYGANKMNTYIYGPKDDPYHSCPDWRKPYPEKEARQLKELVKVAKENEVDFVWAIHPGQDIKWNSEDREILLAKFESMYQLGIRSFAVFFDDISGEGTDPRRQAELLNEIDDCFVKVKKDVTPLIMCPTEYNKSWSNPARGYLKTLGEELNSSVQIMWTGDRVISDITKEGLAWVNPQIRRPAYIWWNFPVSDYVRDHLLMGAVYGNDTEVKDEMSGFVTNPMEHAEASKIAIFSVADYAWNPRQFNSQASWKAAVKVLLPQQSEALQTFVNHNSDLGVNVHGYRREESVDIQPVAERFLKDYRQGKYGRDDFKALADEFERILETADLLLVDEGNKELVAEMTPWLYQFKVLGESGKEALAMVQAVEEGDKAVFMRKYKHLRALQQRSFQIDQTYNQNPYQPGVKTGSKVMQPLVDSIFVLATQEFNRKSGTALSSEVFTSPHRSFSTVAQFRQLPVRVKTTRVVMSPLLEVVKRGAGEYLGVELDKVYDLQALDADFGVKNSAEWLQLEVSADGEHWTTLPVTQQATQLKAALNCQARYIRLVNKEDRVRESYLRKFIVVTGGK